MGRFRVLTMPFLRKLGICFTLIFLAEVPLSLMVLRRGLDDALAAGFTASRANFPAANINLIAAKNRPPPA